MTLKEEQAYWTEYTAHAEPYVFYDTNEYRYIVQALDIKSTPGARVLEIGCGPGVWTANLARLGATVFHFDLSPSIVQVATQSAAPAPAYGFVADMHFLPFPDSTFDAVFGSMVVHHGRHAQLGREVRRVLKPCGHAVFHENSARNPLLMLSRKTLVGRAGIPRFSSPGEHPLRDAEVAAFAQGWAHVHVVTGRMVLCQLAVKYLARRETGALFRIARGVDDALYRLFPPVRPLSYYQILALEKES